LVGERCKIRWQGAEAARVKLVEGKRKNDRWVRRVEGTRGLGRTRTRTMTMKTIRITMRRKREEDMEAMRIRKSV
jgi:hypothetical protein